MQMNSSYFDLYYHGDQAAQEALYDFSVNIAHKTPPTWLIADIEKALPSLASYPPQEEYDSLCASLADLHGVAKDSILLLNGASEGFALLSALLNPGDRVHLFHPSFTEPEALIRALPGIDVHRKIIPLEEDYSHFLYEDSSKSIQPTSALTILGNPTNPTGRIHDLDISMHKNQGIMVIDEAFMDIADHDACEKTCSNIFKKAAQSASQAYYAAQSGSKTIVLRSLTKSFSIAGLRIGYAIMDPELIPILRARQPSWPLGTLNLAAIKSIVSFLENNPHFFCSEAQKIKKDREYMSRKLAQYGWHIYESAAPYILIRGTHKEKTHALYTFLEKERIALRRCDTFPGLDAQYIRLAVRNKKMVDILLSYISRKA